ncbi:MAG TPA: glutamate-cysteine ligase family protein [bacterium]|nr:glutamate-cysteine ligase family protein [bacterium]
MGEEIPQTRFRPQDFSRFEARLRAETETLRDCFAQESFASEGESVGFELEFALIDETGRPVPRNQEILAKIEDSHLVAELSRFNLEMNSDPHAIRGKVLSILESELRRRLAVAEASAVSHHYHLLMIGTLPSLDESDLHLGTMSPLRRYRALNERLLELRQGRPFHIEIHGREQLNTDHRDVMLEAAATSLQVHLQADFKRARRFFNASLIASAPLVALAANSPYLFGRELWEETRIPLFEQATGLDGGESDSPLHPARVNFGWGYLRESILECFEANLRDYPVLLPVVEASKDSDLAHLRLHNGTIWRWNRPLVVPDAKRGLHVRIEHRVMASGPTPVDVVANIGAYLGLVHHLESLSPEPESALPFEACRENFYRAARQGLEAKLQWIDGREYRAVELWREVLLGASLAALRHLGLDAADLDHYMERTLGGRLNCGQNGSHWQRKWIEAHGRDFRALARAYAEHQRQGLPVAEWKL